MRQGIAPERKALRSVYICPVFSEDDSEDRTFWSKRQIESETDNPKNPYRMNDYFDIDNEYGTLKDLKELVFEVHERGMKILLDLVYFHIGPNAEILKNHPEFAKQDKDGNILCSEWKFPCLDYNCEGLREYLWCNMIYYLTVYDVDGYRCDVASLVPIDFWDEGKKRMQKVKPDSILIEEGTNQKYLLSSFNGLYCFGYHDVLYSVFSGKKTANAFREHCEEWHRNAPNGILTLRDIDNHDTVTDWPRRTEIVAGHEGMELIMTINYIMDGVPMVYCGNEIADESYLSMFANRYYMGKYETTNRHLELTSIVKRRKCIVKKLNELKQNSDVLQNGNTIWLNNDASEKIISFLRKYNDEKILFVGNTTKDKCVSKVEDFFDGEVLAQSENPPKINGNTIIFEPYSYIVLKNK